MTWWKRKGMVPFSWRFDTEHVLFCHRGNLKLDRMGMSLFFEEKSTGHSRKPAIFYDRVKEASPGPRLEMFARDSRDGWTTWGNETPEYHTSDMT